MVAKAFVNCTMRLALLCIALATAACASAAAAGPGPVYDILNRYLPPDVTAQFQLNLTSGPPSGSDEFVIQDSTNNGKPAVAISGSTLSALSMGVGWYLRSIAKCTIAWDGTQLAGCSNGTLPAVGSPPVRVRATVAWRYYFSEQVHSYTTAFWSWNQWQYHLDWCVLGAPMLCSTVN